MSDYRRLLVWQKAHELALGVYHVSRQLPRDEIYGLTAQMRRAAVSVPANIAEGMGRITQRERRHFCAIALGSLNEVEYHLLIAKELEYLDEGQHVPMAIECAGVRRLLVRFMGALRVE